MAQVKGRIINYQNDDLYNTGMLFMTDDSYRGSLKQYANIQNFKVMVFQDKDSESAKGSSLLLPDLNAKAKPEVPAKQQYTLYALKNSQIYKLITSEENDCISHDTFFKAMRANRWLFEAEKARENKIIKTRDEESEDKVKRAFANRDYVDVVVCFSLSRQKHAIYPLIKEKDENKIITKMTLLTDPKYSKSIEVDARDMDRSTFYSFFSCSNEYGQFVDNLMQVSNKYVKVFDSKMQMRLVIEGLNIRNCIDLH